MTVDLLLLYCVLAASLARAVLVQAHLVVPLCTRCGRRRERRALGEQVCRCADYPGK
jgi:hypothetical protein